MWRVACGTWFHPPAAVPSQRDADEFLHTLFQRIEECAPDKRMEAMLDRLLGGTLAQQVHYTAADGSSGKSEHFEPFRVLPLEVKGCATIEQALQVRPAAWPCPRALRGP